MLVFDDTVTNSGPQPQLQGGKLPDVLTSLPKEQYVPYVEVLEKLSNDRWQGILQDSAFVSHYKVASRHLLMPGSDDQLLMFPVATRSYWEIVLKLREYSVRYVALVDRSIVRHDQWFVTVVGRLDVAHAAFTALTKHLPK